MSGKVNYIRREKNKMYGCEQNKARTTLLVNRSQDLEYGKTDSLGIQRSIHRGGTCKIRRHRDLCGEEYLNEWKFLR